MHILLILHNIKTGFRMGRKEAHLVWDSSEHDVSTKMAAIEGKH